jgi:hypothetical protein
MWHPYCNFSLLTKVQSSRVARARLFFLKMTLLLRSSARFDEILKSIRALGIGGLDWAARGSLCGASYSLVRHKTDASRYEPITLVIIDMRCVRCKLQETWI